MIKIYRYITKLFFAIAMGFLFVPLYGQEVIFIKNEGVSFCKVLSIEEDTVWFYTFGQKPWFVRAVNKRKVKYIRSLKKKVTIIKKGVKYTLLPKNQKSKTLRSSGKKHKVRGKKHKVRGEVSQNLPFCVLAELGGFNFGYHINFLHQFVLDKSSRGVGYRLRYGKSVSTRVSFSSPLIPGAYHFDASLYSFVKVKRSTLSFGVGIDTEQSAYLRFSYRYREQVSGFTFEASYSPAFDDNKKIYTPFSLAVGYSF